MGSQYQHVRVPYGLIRALCYPGGTRLAPRVSGVRPPEPEVMALDIPWVNPGNWTQSSRGYTPAGTVISPTTMTMVPTRPVIVPDGLMDSMGNLSNEAYKFFKGSTIRASHFFQCRGCGKDEYVKERKLVHMKACRPLMQAIEDRVRRDKVCVICNQSTSKERWRIPMCSEICVTKWRFSNPDPWLVARRFVLAADPSLLRIAACESTQPNS